MSKLLALQDRGHCHQVQPAIWTAQKTVGFGGVAKLAKLYIPVRSA